MNLKCVYVQMRQWRATMTGTATVLWWDVFGALLQLGLDKVLFSHLKDFFHMNIYQFVLLSSIISHPCLLSATSRAIVSCPVPVGQMSISYGYELQRTSRQDGEDAQESNGRREADWGRKRTKIDFRQRYGGNLTSTGGRQSAKKAKVPCAALSEY